MATKAIKFSNNNTTYLPVTDATLVQMKVGNEIKSVKEVILDKQDEMLIVTATVTGGDYSTYYTATLNKTHSEIVAAMQANKNVYIYIPAMFSGAYVQLTQITVDNTNAFFVVMGNDLWYCHTSDDDNDNSCTIRKFNYLKGADIETLIDRIWYDETNKIVKSQNYADSISYVLTFDTTPTANSINPVTSGGIKSYLDNYNNPVIEDTRTAVVSKITGVAPFSTLADKQRVSIHLAYGTGNSTTLELTLSDGVTTTGEIPVYARTYAGGLGQIADGNFRAGTYMELIYNSSQNRWYCLNLDRDTTTWKMSQTEINNSTDTDPRSVPTAKLLRDNFYTKTDINSASYISYTQANSYYTSYSYIESNYYNTEDSDTRYGDKFVDLGTVTFTNNSYVISGDPQYTNCEGGLDAEYIIFHFNTGSLQNGTNTIQKCYKNKITSRSTGFSLTTGIDFINEYFCVHYTLSNTNGVWSIDDNIKFNESDLCIEITYADLADLRDNGELVPGTKYRITDYTCTTTQQNTQSAGHKFDIIVTAISNGTLSEEAAAIRHDNDTYFSNSNLSAWKVWYCLDNDTNRFSWADSSNGKGIIYRMIDEFNNDCPYDFKNIQFKRKLTDGAYDATSRTDTWVYTFSIWNSTNSEIDDLTLYNRVVQVYGRPFYACENNVIDSHIVSTGPPYGIMSIKLPDNVFLSNNNHGFNNNRIGIESTNNTFFGFGHHNNIGMICQNNILIDSFGNILEFGCSNNIFDNASHNKLGSNADYCTFNSYCSGNIIGNCCSHIIFGSYCTNNSIGNGCEYITFNNDYTYNCIVENGNRYITLSAIGKTNNINSKLCNITIAQGVNTTSTNKTITHPTLNDNFQTVYRNNASGTTESGIVALKSDIVNIPSYISNITQTDINNWNSYGNVITSLPAYTTSTPLAIGDNYDAAFSKLSKIIEDDELVTSRALTYINDNVNDLSYEIDSINSTIDLINTDIEDLSARDKPLMIETTWSDLVDLRNNAELVPGTWYVITDYETTTTQTDTRAMSNYFDVLVFATSNKTLSEEAKAAVSGTRDGYFGHDYNNSRLDAWKIWYYLDNDTSMFTWADQNNGKGVIYRMIDEFGNDCPYDFKNIQFKRKTINGIYSGESLGTFNWVYTFNLYNIQQNIQRGDASVLGNQLGNGDIRFVTGVHDNKIDNYVIYDDPNAPSSHAYPVLKLPNNVFLTTSIGSGDVHDDEYEGCYGNKIGINCFDNTFGAECHNNILGSGSNRNDFAKMCKNNKLGNECYYNHFNDNCYNNILYDYCNTNTLHESTHDNILYNLCFQNSIQSNSSCNILYNDCQSNTIKSYSYYNILYNNCISNITGSYCSHITFKNNCSSCIIGTGSSTTKNYCSFIMFEEDCSNVNLTTSATTSSSNNLRYITIGKGISRKTITHPTVKDAFETKYTLPNSQVISV